MVIEDIKSRIFKDSKGNNVYTNVSVEEMDWLVEMTEKWKFNLYSDFVNRIIELEKENKALKEELIDAYIKRGSMLMCGEHEWILNRIKELQGDCENGCNKSRFR